MVLELIYFLFSLEDTRLISSFQGMFSVFCQKGPLSKGFTFLWKYKAAAALVHGSVFSLLTIHHSDVPHDWQFQRLFLQRHCVGTSVFIPLQGSHRDNHRWWWTTNLFLLEDNWWTVFTKTGHFHMYCACRRLSSVFCKNNKEIQRVKVQSCGICFTELLESLRQSL